MAIKTNVLRFAASSRKLGAGFLESEAWVSRVQLIVAVMTLCVLSVAQAPTQSGTRKSAPPAAPTQTQPQQATPAEAQQLPPDAPVVKAAGLCSDPSSGATCQTVITRAEFDRLVEAVNPKLNQQQKRQLASLYVQMLVLANEGEKAGVEKDPGFQERLKLERLRMLAQAAEKHLHDTTEPTQQQIDVFYAQNTKLFEEVHLLRVTIPKTVNGEFNDKAAKDLAQKIRARATEGKKFADLQAEVWSTEKSKGTPPNPDLGWKRQAAVDQRYETQLAALQTGEVSPVLEDAQNEYVYKLAEKRPVPLAQVRKDIAAALQQQLFSEKINQLLDSVKTDLNESYFGPAPENEKPPAQEKPPALPH